MERDFDVNPAFDEWRLSTGRQKEWALNTLIERMDRYARAICWQRLPEHKNELDALVNGIVWRAIKRADTFRRGSRFSTWFYHIIVNECNRFLRNFKERCETVLEDEGTVEVQETIAAQIDLAAMLNGLEGKDHLLFRLVAEGQDFKTIADTLQIGISATKMRWSRLKEKLKDAAL